MNRPNNGPHHPRSERAWLPALGFAVPITGLILTLMIKWFALDNRYVTFLYHHGMGPRVPDTRPFSPVTRSRYWVAGLVVAGAVMVLTAGGNLLMRQLSKRYRWPAWWKIWVLCAVPLAIGIPAITMTANSPTLPAWLAGLIVTATLGGLALALLPGQIVTERPLEAALLGLDGLCLALWLLALPGLEYAATWIAGGRGHWFLMLVLLPLVGLTGLAILTPIRALLHVPNPTLQQLSLAALVVAYVFFPILHHVAGTDGIYYISNMENFFTRDIWIQAGTFASTLAVIWATACARRTMLGS